jgi:poly(3-hydroxybutyrate) depolymerase
MKTHSATLISIIRSAAAIALALAVTASAAEKIVKRTFPSDGESRTCYLFVPDSAKDKPAPLVITLHGSGRDGRILVDHWESIAKKEGIILAGPDATVRDGWNMGKDSPLLLKDLVDDVKAKYTIDPRRVYLFGHSAGAIHALKIGVLESEYFAAVAVHAGAFEPEFAPYLRRAPRKIPIAIWVGTNDSFFPLAPVRATRDALNQEGFDARLTEIKGHTHDYYGRSSEINKAVWAFFRDKQLDFDPQYQQYVIAR